MTETSRAPWRFWLPAGLFAVALLVRLLGIGWGLANDLHNQSYHPDELPIWGYSQQIEPAQFKFTPGFYNYGTLYLTCLSVTSDMVGAYTGGAGATSGQPNWAYISRCHLAGRVINAFAGAGTVMFLFLIMRRFAGPIGGTVSALGLLAAPGHVVHSRFQTVDVFAVFLLAVSAYFALRLIPIRHHEYTSRDITQAVILSAVFAGLSAGTKYTGVLGLLTLWSVLLMCHRGRAVRDIPVSILACAVAFFVATPGSVFDFDRFRDGLAFEFSHSGSGHGLVFAGTSSGYIYHIGNLISGLGGLVLLLGIAGLAYGAVRQHRWAIALLAFAIPYYLLIGHAQDKYMRYTLPLDIALACGFGYAVTAGHIHGIRSGKPGWGHVVAAVGIVAFGGAVAGAARETLWMMGTDPRDQAATYLKHEAAGNSSMVVGLASDPWYWTPPLFPDTAEPRAVRFEKRMEQMAAAQSPRVAYYIPSDAPPHAFDPRLITETKPTDVSYSSLEQDPLARLSRERDLPPGESAAAREYVAFQTALQSDYSLDRQFGEPGDMVEDMQYVQPLIYIWKRKPTP